ncbi:MAG: polyamine aminopropyltransferase [Armatimonadota bacterium]|nr:polyamine aminopropyltransferase [Armatimonadota bacterium]MDR7450461.1 polyamine aminopropyltransferase [Armatimonadota bacterium]MDR7466956.1 polyamine aminopropyltransferase [Armatimonadota bacterium]MDR7493502.1 polyamine aminopropyltransferase [Armatimonadota bacterium]MDR7498767.1 polyamine aminopropyltransferase [Armatimonadota bacterium]
MQWIVDVVGEGFGQALAVEDILYDHYSPFQHIQVATSPHYGRMLILDDAVQTTERDEHIYHEMLVHLPLAAHSDPRRVLIIGGGDGGTLEEVLKHPVETVTMVEIDREVVEVSRAYLPSIGGRAFDEPRTRLLIADGIAFVESTSEKFDAILVDSTDPKGPGLALFSAEFYRACAGALNPSGVLAVQSGSPLYQRELADQVRRHLAASFPAVLPYWAAVPSYPGTLWSFTLAQSTPGEFRHLTIPGLRYYSPAVARAALNFPPLP